MTWSRAQRNALSAMLLAWGLTADRSSPALDVAPGIQTFSLRLGDRIEKDSPGPGAGVLDFPTSYDVYELSVDEPQAVWFDAPFSRSCQVHIALNAPDGSQLLTSDDGRCQPAQLVVLPSAGTYRLVVGGSRFLDAHYVLSLLPTRRHQAPDVFDIAIGDTVEPDRPRAGAGRFEGGGERDVYRFTVSAPQDVFYDTLECDTQAPPQLQLIDPNGDRAWSSQPMCGGATIALPYAGEYRLVVTAPDARFTPRYAFRLSAARDEEFDIAVGDAVRSGVPGPGAGHVLPGRRDVFRFSIDTPQWVWMTGLPTSGASLIDPSGAQVDLPSGGDAVFLPRAGQYRLSISGETGRTTYSFTLRHVRGVHRGQTFDVAIGDTVSPDVPGSGAGKFGAPGEEDAFRFAVDAKTTIVVQPTGGPSCGPQTWYVVGPDERPLATGACTAALRAELPAGGTYQLRVRSMDPTASSYGFALRSAASMPLVEEFTLGVDEEVADGVPAVGAGRLDAPDQQDIFRIAIGTPRKVTIVPTASLCTWSYTLRDPDGRILTEPVAPIQGGRQSCTPHDYVLSRVGEYVLAVSSAFDSAYGFRLADGGAADSTIPPLEQFTLPVGTLVTAGMFAPGAGTIAVADQQDVFAFPVEAGVVYEIAPYEGFQSFCDDGWCGDWLGPVSMQVADDHGVPQTTSRLEVERSGVWTINVRASYAGTTAGYSFAVWRAPPEQARFTLPVGSMVGEDVPAPGAGYLGVRGEQDSYEFRVEPGHRYVVESRGSPFFPIVRDETGSQRFGRLVADRAGTWTATIAASGQYFASAIGPYEFGVIDVSAAPVQEFALPLGKPVTNDVPGPGAGMLGEVGERDVYSFAVTAGQRYVVAGSPGNVHRTAEIRDSAGIPVTTVSLVSTNAAITAQRSELWTLTVSATQGATGPYTFKVTRATSTSPTPLSLQRFSIAVGASVTDGVPGLGAGRLDSTTERDVYAVAVTAGRRYVFKRLSGNVQMRILDEGGTDLPVGAAEQVLVAERSGVWSVLVDAPFTGPGTYGFSLMPHLPPTHNLTITPNTPVVPGGEAGAITQPGERDVYRFESQVGQRFQVKASGNLLVSARDPFGIEVGPDSSFQAVAFTAFQSGTYTIAIQRPRLETGPYALTLYASAATVIVPLTFESPVSGSTGTPLTDVVYTFDGSAGQTYRFENLATATVPASWNLRGPDGFVLFTENLSGGLSPRSVMLPASGRYALTLVANGPDVATFLFRVTPLAAGTPPTSAPIQVFDVEVANRLRVLDRIPLPGAGLIESGGAIDQYRFQTVRGTRLCLQLQDPRAGLKLNLRTPAGATLLDAAPSPFASSPPTVIVAPETGVYTLSFTATGPDQPYGFDVWNLAAPDVPAPRTRTTTTVFDPRVITTTGEPVTFHVMVNSHSQERPTGSVVVRDGAREVAELVLDPQGIATYTTDTLAEGTHRLGATYLGSATMEPSSGELVYAVRRPAAAVSLAVSDTTVERYRSFRTTVVVSVQPGDPAPTGSVTVECSPGCGSGSGRLDGSGTAVVEFAPFAIGEASLVASYAGDSVYGARASSPIPVTIARSQPTLTLQSSANPSIEGRVVAFTAKLGIANQFSPFSIGLVTFRIDGKPVSTFSAADGPLTFRLPAPERGTYDVDVSFGGDGNVASAVSNVIRQVVSAGTSTRLDVAPAAAAFGDPVTLTGAVTVEGAPVTTGEVEFRDATRPLDRQGLDADGRAVLVATDLDRGKRELRAAYLGDVTYPGSFSAVVPVTVAGLPVQVTVAASANPVFYGEAMTFSGLVSASRPELPFPTGSLTLRDGETILGTWPLSALGTFQIPIAFQRVGLHAITATYAGDRRYAPATSNGVELAVDRARTSMAIQRAAAVIADSEDVEITAVLDAERPAFGRPTGEVQLVEGAVTAATATLTEGQAVLRARLPVGHHVLAVRYSGDAAFRPKEVQGIAVEVRRTVQVSITPPSGPTGLGEPASFEATVRAADGALPVPTGTVELLEGNIAVAATTLSAEGRAMLSTRELAAGTRTLRARYASNAVYAAGFSPGVTHRVEGGALAVTLETHANPTGLGKPLTLLATLRPLPPAILLPTGFVGFYANGLLVGTAAVNSRGQAPLTITTLGLGETELVARYSGGTSYASAESGIVMHQVEDALDVAIDPGVRVVKAGEVVPLHAMVTGAGATSATVRWDMGGGVGVDGRSATHSFERPGIYTIVAVANSTTQEAYAKTEFRVLEDALLRADAGDDRVLTIDSPARFDARNATPAFGVKTYRWEFGDGTTSSNAVVDHRWNAAGTYTVKLTITGWDTAAERTVDSDTAMVTVREPPPPNQRVTVSVRSKAGELLVGATVVVVDQKDGRFRGVTGDDGIAYIEGLTDGFYTAHAIAGGFLPAQAGVKVQQRTGAATVVLTPGTIGVARLEHRRMTYDEIVDAGILVDHPENAIIYRFEVTLSFVAEPVRIYVQDNGRIWAGRGSGCDVSCHVDRPDYRTTINARGTPDVPVLYVLVIPGEARYLKEFFEVALIVTNSAGGHYAFVDGQGHLNLPPGLSLADTATAQENPFAMADVPGGSTVTAKWFVRGDVEGEYRLTADYTAVLFPLSTPVNLHAVAEQPLKVWGASATKMVVEADDRAIRGSPYRVRVGLHNVSDHPVYNASFEFAKEGKLNYIYQPRQQLRFVQREIAPGETWWTDLTLVPLLTGSLNLERSFVRYTGGNADFEDEIRVVPGIPDAERPHLRGERYEGYMLLDWDPIPGAAAYQIFVSSGPTIDFPHAFVTQMPPDTTSLAIPLSEVPPGFFAISTVTDNAERGQMRHNAVGGRALVPTTFGFDTYGELVANVHVASGNLVWGATDAQIETVGPDLAITRSYNSYDTRSGLFGVGWSSLLDMRAERDASGTVTITHADGRREPHSPAPGGGFEHPPSYPRTLADVPGGGWRLESKDKTSAHVFDGAGRLIAVGDGYGRALRLDYGPAGLLRIRDEVSGRALHVTVEGGHIREVRTDPINGAPLVWRYDYAGDLLRAVCDARNPDLASGACTRMDYVGSRLAGVRLPRGNDRLRVHYDPEGRVEWTKNGADNRTTFVYDGGRTTVRDPRAHETVYHYDLEYRTTEIRYPGDARTKYEYDANGYRSKVTDPNDNFQTFTYDDKGNLTSETNAEGNTTYHDYLESRRIATRDARSSDSKDDTYKTKFAYNSAGDLLTETTPATAEYPSGVIKQTTYTAGGEDHGWGPVPPGLVRTTNAGYGADRRHDYDTQGNLRRRVDSTGLTTTFEYDALGRMVSQSVTWETGSATATYTWSRTSKPATVTGPVVPGTGGAPDNQLRTITRYDANDNPDEIESRDLTSGATRVEKIGYDDADRERSRTDPEGGVTSRTYDGNGNVTTVTDAEKRVVRTVYDERNLAVEMRHEDFADDPLVPDAPTRTVVLKTTTYDRAGRMTDEYTPGPGSGPDGASTIHVRYSYDRADRLLAKTFLGFRNRDGTTRDVELEGYKYDAAGNKIETRSNGGRRIVSDVIDAAGRLQTSTSAGNPTRITEIDYLPTAEPTRIRVSEGGSFTEQRFHYLPNVALPDKQIIENDAVDLVTYLKHDQRGLQVAAVSPRGAGPDDAAHRTESTYDGLGRLVEQQSPPVPVEVVSGSVRVARPTTRYGYDAFGNQTHVVDVRGNATRTLFDKLDRRVAVSHPTYTAPAGGARTTPTETWTYDKVGNLRTSTDRRGQVTTHVYDGRNRPVVRRDPRVSGQSAPGEQWSRYDDAGNRVFERDQTGAIATQVFDDMARVRTSTQVVRQDAPAGAFTTTMDYDDFGNVVYRRDPDGVVERREYDAESRLRRVIDGRDAATTYEYDVAGRATKVTDALGRMTQTIYDPAGRAIETRRLGPDGGILSRMYFEFDAAGNQTVARSARSSSSTDSTFATRFEYDALGRLMKVTSPDALGPIVATFGHDAAGNTTRVTNGRGHTTRYTYNPWNLGESTIEPSTSDQAAPIQRTFTTVYDAAGLPIEELQPGATIARTFDELGRLTREVGSGAGLPSATRAFAYDLVGRRTSVNHPFGTVAFSYDDRGLLLTSSSPGRKAPEATFSYGAAGRLASRRDSAGTTRFGFDPSTGRLSTVIDGLTKETIVFTRNLAGQVEEVEYGSAGQRRYEYDVAGRLRTDMLRKGSVVHTSTTYTYDAEDNMTTQNVVAPGNALAGRHKYAYDRSGRLVRWAKPGSASVRYAYDEAGNRTEDGKARFTYDTRNRLLSGRGATFSWSARGTLMQEKSGSGSVRTYTFDGLGRQAAVGATGYEYDGLDRLTKRAGVALRYAGLEGDPVVFGTEQYARSPTGRLVAAKNGNAPTFVGRNRHGDVAWYLATEGTVTGTSIYDPWGIQTSGGTQSTSLGFQSDVTDPDTGEVWMGARWYAPTTAGFTARDSILGALRTPVSLNRYTYAHNDPLQYFDPDGRRACDDPRHCGALANPGRHFGNSRTPLVQNGRMTSSISAIEHSRKPKSVSAETTSAKARTNARTQSRATLDPRFDCVVGCKNAQFTSTEDLLEFLDSDEGAFLFAVIDGAFRGDAKKIDGNWSRDDVVAASRGNANVEKVIRGLLDQACEADRDSCGADDGVVDALKDVTEQIGVHFRFNQKEDAWEDIDKERNWLERNRGIIATLGAAAVCIGSSGTACGVATALAFGVRAQQNIEVMGGWRNAMSANVADALVTTATFGFGSTVKAAKAAWAGHVAKSAPATFNATKSFASSKFAFNLSPGLSNAADAARHAGGIVIPRVKAFASGVKDARGSLFQSEIPLWQRGMVAYLEAVPHAVDFAPCSVSDAGESDLCPTAPSPAVPPWAGIEGSREAEP